MRVASARRKLRPMLLTLGCFSVLVPAAVSPFQPAQQQPQPVQGPTLKVNVDIVNVYAVVRDKRRLVSDLTRDDFELSEDGVSQEIRYFSRQTDTPLTLALGIDTSPSQQRVLPAEQEAAKQFVREVLRPKDMFAVLHFDLDVELLQDFTSAVQYLTHAIDETQINGGGAGPLPSTFPTSRACCTHLYDAAYLASAQLRNEVGRKVLILVTDGQDEGSQETLDQALEAAQKAEVITYSILLVDRSAYGPGGLGYSGESVLKKLSAETGGRVISANNPRNTAQAFEEIANELRTQYLLGYAPSNRKHDGAFRHIRLRVKQGHYEVQARRGYYAPSDQ